MTDVVCPLCATPRRALGNAAWVRCAGCDAMVFRPGKGPRVLVVHGSEDAAQQLGTVLLEAGFSPIRVGSGREALAVQPRVASAAAVVDVAVEDILVFELVAQLKAATPADPVKIVLVASVFNKTAYKRRPGKLHGADDYVEQHHVPDMLPQKLARLMNAPPAAEARYGAERRERIRDAEARNDLSGARRVQVLAYSIVADIALYYQAEVEAALRGAVDAELERALAEGRALLAEFVNPEDYAGSDPIAEAFRGYLEALRRVGP